MSTICKTALILSALLTFLVQTVAFAETEEEQIFENSLGMRFKKIPGMNVKLSIWETRVQDYNKFIESTSGEWIKPYFEQENNHPVVNISWEDAQSFCDWLNKEERKKGLLSESAMYRLPKVEEWMAAAKSILPAKYVGVNYQENEFIFPWGEGWPMPNDFGNYAAQLARDDYAETSPVGSFAKKQNDFSDLGGNVWEWCLDYYEGAADLRVLKGGSWRMREASSCLLQSRIGNVTGMRLPTYGFRILISE